MDANRDKPSLRTCPRCAYDLSGQIHAAEAASADFFPATGTCSECGLEFWWGDIFNPSRHRVPGFIEHERRGHLRAACRTWCLCLIPARFWNLIRIEMEPQLQRLALWLWYLIVAPSLLAAAIATSILYWNPMPPASVGDFLVEVWSMGLASREYRGSGFRVVWLESVPVFVLAPLAVSLLLPLIFLGLPDTRRVSRVRGLHVARGAAYGFAWLVPIVILRALWLIVASVLFFFGLLTNGRFQADVFDVLELIANARQHVLGSSTLLFVVAMIWLMAWWHAALRHGWRIREYNKVWWALMVPAWLIAAIAALVSNYGLQIL